ncbi:Fibroin heavy chain precursor (Fib-H) (H-fibroin) [Actinokineospora spheciospongiae]|uniref:Fibroin heavy chain (Fib-H) (H-fibroin) n=1 Tax=Actinokineospora spheciospongiae TaxID=909613 RepID=W7JB20_9PSEU|nr:toxin glutamine deamidase domain-containing protein [Actinokineospora spheciospongiae]EWC63259.1 Fibroin heavy chain precursor (Fib-H) (H-fibroin) [Actinokineospora spheciospongiae]
MPHLNYSEPVPVDHAPRDHDLSGYDPPGPGEHPRVQLEAIGPDTSGWEQVKRKVDDWADDGNVLYRGDSRPPSEIAREQGFGLKNPDGVVDIKKHVLGTTNAYVSTSKSVDIAARFGAKSEGYVYRVKAPGGTLTEETQARAGDQSGTQYREGEVLFPGGIHFSHVEGWHKTFADARGNVYLGEFEPNPHYTGGAREDAPAHPKGLEQPDQGHVPPPVAPPKHVLERQERERAIAEGRDPDAPADPAPAADPTPDPGASERDHTPIGGRFDPSLLDPDGEPTGDQHTDNQPTDGSRQPDSADTSADTTAHQDPAEPPPTPARSISAALDGLEGPGEPEGLARPGPPLTEPAVHSGVGDEQSRQAFLDEHFPGYGDINPHHADSGAADGHRTNCVEAMLADERRHHGEPAQAAPTRPEDVATDGRLSRVREALGGVWTSHRDFDAVASAVARTPEGARGAVAFRYTDADGHAIGHVVRVVHTPGGVAFADPQTGRLAELPAGATEVRLLSADHTDDTAHADVPDDGGYGRSPGERRDQAVDEVDAESGSTDPLRRALADTHDVARGYTVVDVAARTHDDLVAKVAADPGHRVVFPGRDGHSPALATRAPNPGCFDRHATEVVLSRAVVDVAEEAAARRAGGGPWRAALAARAERGRDQVRSWVAGDDPDPRFREVVDSLVRRGDEGAVEDVEERTRDLDPEARRRVWAEFDALPPVRERTECAARTGVGRS